MHLADIHSQSQLFYGLLVFSQILQRQLPRVEEKLRLMR